jgi:DNA-binding NtrC family response regulator
MDGLELLSKIKSINSDTIVILMTAFGSVESAVEAMKNGAYDYIRKPFQFEEMLLLLERIKELRSIKQENIYLRSHFESKYDPGSIIGSSPTVQQIRESVKNIANSSTTVLITGETGTGKELLTNIIHFNSNRLNKPLIKVNCPVFSREIFESELFGHEQGAFTGAREKREGRFERADGGTVYLDDVEDIPMDLQVKLLRVLQEQEFERVGGNETIKVDVRIIASTKSDLKMLVKKGEFREDLYYRLNIFPIHLSPLRERIEDIPLLINYYFKKLLPEIGIKVHPEAMKYFKNYKWPGNVRELINIVERLILLYRGRDIDVSKVPLEVRQPESVIPEVDIGQEPLYDLMANIEANVIRQALQMSGDNQARAAEILNIPPSTLRSKMNKYGIN